MVTVGAKAQVQGDCKLVSVPLAFAYTIWGTPGPMLSSKIPTVPAFVRPQT